MWFNILKNEGRRAAYRLFVNSMVHLGELIPPKPPTEVLNEGGIRLLTFETSNGHFEWEVEYLKNGSMGKIYLASAPNDIEPHIDYIEGMFEQEYPDQYAALQEFFVENAPLSLETTEGGDSDSPIIPKKVFRKMRSIFSEFTDAMEENIISDLPQFDRRNRVVRYIRGFFTENFPTTTGIQIQFETNKKNRRGTLPQYRWELLQAPYTAWRRYRTSRLLTWEHIANFWAHFRESIIREIEGNTPEEVIMSFLEFDLERAYIITKEIWNDASADRQLLMENLPIDRILNLN